MASLRRHEGYLMIDHRNSPGVSAELIQQSGKSAPIVGAGALHEAPIITCSHCQAGMMLNPMRTRNREYCAKCDHYICDRCALVLKVTLECKPFRQVLDTLQEQAVLIGQ
jgi:hypothetical protein